MNTSTNLDKRKRLVRLIAFISTIIFSSTAVMFATFTDNGFILAVILVPCVVTLSISVIPVPVSARGILSCAIVSALISLGVIGYVWFAEPEIIKEYLGYAHH